MSSVSQTSIRLKGRPILGAEDRQRKIAGFDQAIYSRSRVLCIGAGGLIGHIAPTLVRKGIGGIKVLDDDQVEASNLNRQRFFERDIGANKALALAENLQRECIVSTDISGFAVRFEEAIARGLNLNCNVAICGVDNNPARVAASRYFRKQGTPLIITAVGADADHGYVFVQEPEGPCFGCVFPDSIDSKTYPCPGTPAVADILQIVGGIAVYAVDSLLMNRPRQWNYRRVVLSCGDWDTSTSLKRRRACPLCFGS